MTQLAEAPVRGEARSLEAIWNAPSRAEQGDVAPVMRWAAVLALVVSALCLSAGTAALAFNSADALRLVMSGGTFLAFGAFVVTTRRETGAWHRDMLGIAAAALLVTLIFLVVPEYTYGHELNGIIHRSLLSSLLMIGLGLPATSTAAYYAMGGGPTAWDRSRYPLLLFPIALILAAYGAIIIRLIIEGAPDLSWDLLTTSYKQRLVGSEFVVDVGMRNQLLGTLLLVGMTAAIALPIGVGAGAYMAEHDGWTSMVIRFCTLVLRAISVFILGVTAFTLADWSAQYAPGDTRSDLLRGFYLDDAGFKIAGHGSYITAAIVLSMLVIPVISRATEEGFRSVPREIREGSVALGATEGHGFTRILLPWAFPNIITGLLLGCAEAAGSVAVILFIAGTGEFGVGPLRDVTSLSFLVYYADRGPKTFLESMGEYRYASALLLIIITFTFSIAALLLKRQFGKRYEGSGVF
jgi:phosphate transport system permease protein